MNSLLYWQSIYYSSHNHSIHQSSPKMHYIYVPTSSVKSWIAQRIRTPSGLPYMLFLFLLSFYLSFTYLCICQNNKYHERDRNFNYPICALRFVNIIDSKSGNFEIFLSKVSFSWDLSQDRTWVQGVSRQKNRPLIGIPDRSANLPLLQLSLFSVKMHLPSGDVIYMLFVIVLHCFCR